MDVDVSEDASQSSPLFLSSRRRITVPVDDAHPFDLDAYIANYTGRTAVDRLLHIILTCPSVASQAFELVVQHIHQLRDPSLYQTALSAYDQLPSQTTIEIPPSSDLATLDPKWTEETIAKNQNERMRLEMELKTYSNNMIKESIRMGHRDLGDFYRSVGEHATALKHYTKSREFCTTSHHVIEMCLSVLELLIEQKNYSHISTYVFKADAALDAAAASAANAGNAGNSSSAPATGLAKKSAEREKVQSKLDLATAISHLGQGNYEKAATTFLSLGPVSRLGDWIGKIVAAGDIAIYGTLCALSSLSRSAIKSKVLENSTFGVYVEQEPYIRELVEAYLSSNFKTVLELLSRYSTRHYADIHLATHVQNLTNLTRNWAVVLYFQPFASIKLDRMSAAFGWSVEEVEQHVVALIQSGDIKARVDSQNKVLQAKKTDYRADLFARAIRAGTEMQSSNRKLLLRMRLQQADLVVKPPKGSQGGSMQSSDLLQD